MSGETFGSSAEYLFIFFLKQGITLSPIPSRSFFFFFFLQFQQKINCSFFCMYCIFVCFLDQAESNLSGVG